MKTESHRSFDTISDLVAHPAMPSKSPGWTRLARGLRFQQAGFAVLLATPMVAVSGLVAPALEWIMPLAFFTAALILDVTGRTEVWVSGIGNSWRIAASVVAQITGLFVGALCLICVPIVDGWNFGLLTGLPAAGIFFLLSLITFVGYLTELAILLDDTQAEHTARRIGSELLATICFGALSFVFSSALGFLFLISGGYLALFGLTVPGIPIIVVTVPFVIYAAALSWHYARLLSQLRATIAIRISTGSTSESRRMEDIRMT